MVRVILIVASLVLFLVDCSKTRTIDSGANDAKTTGEDTDAPENSNPVDESKTTDAAASTAEASNKTHDAEMKDVATDQGEVASDDNGSLDADAGDTIDELKCKTTPTLLLDESDLLFWTVGLGISGGMDLAVSTTDLYIAFTYPVDGVPEESGALLRVPIQGGTRRRMTRIIGSAQALLVTGDSVVVASSYRDEDGNQSGEIVRMDLLGDEKSVLATAPITNATLFGPHGILATDGQSVYFSAQDGTKRVSLEGGAVETLTNHTGPLAVVGSNVVIADESEGALFSIPLEGGPETILAANLTGTLGHVLSCGTDICWTSTVPDIGTIGPSGTGSLMRLGSSGGPIVLTTELYGTHRLVFDGSDFFVTKTLGIGASLVRIPDTGGPPIDMGIGDGLAIDDACLYTGTVTRGVYSVAKSYRGRIPLP